MSGLRLAIFIICLIGSPLLALAGCGGSGPPGEGEPEGRSPACEAVGRAALVRILGAAGAEPQPLERTANDSLDLSACEFRERRGPELYIEVSIDTAPKTARRYYNMLAEARQRATFTAISDASRPRGIPGVGNDATHGGVGAYWVPLRRQLTAIGDGRIVRAGVHARALSAAAAREASVALAERALARSPRERPR